MMILKKLVISSIITFYSITTFCTAIDLPIELLPNIPAFEQIFNLLTPHDINKYSKIRLGRANDGGYVVPLQLISLFDRCYTYGVATDFSFESDLVARNEKTLVRMYDHTVGNPVNLSPRVYFKQEGIGAKQEGPINTYQNHIIENNDTAKNILLKMDIEGAEWNVLESFDSELFKKISVFIVEFHWFNQIDKVSSYQKILEKLSQYFTPFHIHGNNCATLLSVNNKIFPNVIEVTYINNNLITSKDQLTKPLEDSKEIINCPDRYMYPLSYWLTK